MAKSADEIGCVSCLMCGKLWSDLFLSYRVCSLRIGFGYAFSSFAMLTGTPIDGALLGPDNHWHKPIIFSGVSNRTACHMFWEVLNFSPGRSSVWIGNHGAGKAHSRQTKRDPAHMMPTRLDILHCIVVLSSIVCRARSYPHDSIASSWTLVS